MSMRDYAFMDWGMVLNGLVDDDVLEEMAEDETVESQFSFTGEALPLNDKGEPGWNHGDSFDDGTVYYLSSHRSPRLFEAAYAGMDEFVSDLLSQYRRARRSDRRLPRLTAAQVRERLRAIQGTYYG